jgi:putative peptidoglycan lipid II flippase
MTEPIDEPTSVQADGAVRSSLASAGRSAVILTGATALVQLLGIVRELYLAGQVGVSVALDALLIGLVLPTTFANVLSSGVTFALVPAYVEARRSHGLEAAKRVAGTVLAWVVLVGIIATFAMETFASQLITVTGPGLSEAGHDSAVGYLRLLAPTAIAVAMSGILYAVCQAENHFRAIAVSLLAAPITTLVVMIALWDRLDLQAFALGSFAGPVASFLVLLVAVVRRSIRPRLHLVTRGLGLGAFVRHATPLTISSAILQLNVVFDRALATLLAPGAVSALRYGDTLVRVPTGAISPAWGAAIYPALVQSTHQTEATGLGASTTQALRYVIALFTPVALLTLAVAPIAVSTAYGRGAFSRDDLMTTSVVVAGFAPLVLVLMLSQTLTGALNALRGGTDLLMAGVLNVVLNCSLDVALGLPLGIAGIALSSSLTAAATTLLKARRLARREASFRPGALLRNLAIASAASLPATLVIGWFAWAGMYSTGFFEGLITLAVLGTTGMASYLVLATWLGLAEPRVLVSIATRWVGRARPGPRSAG